VRHYYRSARIIDDPLKFRRERADVSGEMWNLVNCYLSGRHDYGMWCEPGSIFLRCIHCGKRSSGWSLEPKGSAPLPAPAVVQTQPPGPAAVIPFRQAS
jgi:hypothetical protein